MVEAGLSMEPGGTGAGWGGAGSQKAATESGRKDRLDKQLAPEPDAAAGTKARRPAAAFA
ncbi:MAG: hypothetical protein ACM3X3_02360 [Betaproteobacteria bacterium]